MKYGVLIIATLILFLTSACNKSELSAPVILPNQNANTFSGLYAGLYSQTYNGAANDSGGVFKDDTSYYYSVTILPDGPDSIIIEKGAFAIKATAVVNNEFQLVYKNHQIYGRFTGDSMYVHCKALQGLWDVSNPSAEWFALQTLDFVGKKIY